MIWKSKLEERVEKIELENRIEQLELEERVEQLELSVVNLIQKSQRKKRKKSK